MIDQFSNRKKENQRLNIGLNYTLTSKIQMEYNKNWHGMMEDLFDLFECRGVLLHRKKRKEKQTIEKLQFHDVRPNMF